MLDWFSSSFLPQSKGVHGRLIVVSKLLIVRWIGTLSHLVPCDLLPCTLVALFMIIRSSRSLLDCVTVHILFFNFWLTLSKKPVGDCVSCVRVFPDQLGRVHPDVGPSRQERNGREGDRHLYGGREDESHCGQAALKGKKKNQPSVCV